MEQLVADLLLLARLDEGRPMEQRSVDLVALCAEAVHTASAVGPDWPLSFEPSQPVEVVGDATSLRQVIDNLLGNVRAHTPPGTSARVVVDRTTRRPSSRWPMTDPGMDPEEAEPRLRALLPLRPVSRSRANGGAGLGLSIVSAIVAAHGGTVRPTPGSDHGTTFTVHLPLTPPSSGGSRPGRRRHPLIGPERRSTVSPARAPRRR